MSGIDVVVGLVLLVLAWQGFSRGLVGPFVVVGIIVVTPQVASRITPVFDSLMEALSLDLPFFLHQPVIFVVAIVLTAIAVGLASAILTGLAEKLFPPFAIIQVANRIAGLALAVGAGVLILGTATALASGFLGTSQQTQLKGSKWGQTVVPAMTPLSDYVSSQFSLQKVVSPCDLSPEVISVALAKAAEGSSASAETLLNLLPAQPASDDPSGDLTAARAFFEAVASGVDPRSLPPEASVAAASTFKTMMKCQGTDGDSAPAAATGLPVGSTDTVLQFLQPALTAQGTTPSP